jgi:signal transduction histidine kinase
MSSSVTLMPHAVCWAAAPRLVWTMVVTNLITFLSYVTICFTLFFLARRTRRVIARDWAYFVIGFALFIVACGSTHLLEVITTWMPIFWVDAWTNIITALLSAYVAIMLIRRARTIGFGINDYAARLANTETEKFQMQESLLAAQRLEEWGRMSAILAHEISNPLEAVQNALHIIKSTHGVSPEVIDLAQTAADEAARVTTISRSTLSFFRQTTEPESIDLAAAAESVRFLLDPLIREHGITLDVHTTGDVKVEAIPGETRQVLLNLVRNACEATTRPGSLVNVHITGHSSAVEIVVADQGSGIAPGALSTLFQFGKSTKGERGNGMGLWTAQRILTKHGGDIRVESRLGEGTRFILRWPRAYASREASSAMPGNAPHRLILSNSQGSLT